MICTGAEKVILSVLVFPKRPEEWEEMGWHIEIGAGGIHQLWKDDIYEYPYYWAQVLNEMGYFHQYEIKANSELQGLMLEKYSKFWNENILKQITPECVSYEDIKMLCPIASGTLIASEEIERFAAEYKNISSEIGQGGSLAKRKNQIRLEILNYMISLDKRVETIQDEDSVDKFILRSRDGKKLFSYDGKVFR